MRICQNLEVEFRRVSKLSTEASFRHTHARVPARRDAMDAAARKEKMKRDNENASAIAEKLLQGWTMLAEYCPVEGCVTPLMRSRLFLGMQDLLQNRKPQTRTSPRTSRTLARESRLWLLSKRKRCGTRFPFHPRNA